MKVIGAGLPRTATLSQKLALEALGFGPCYHMVDVLADLSLADGWRQTLEGRRDWAAVFGGFEATVDWPGSFFYKDLIEAYPDAKVLLSVRSGEAWERSATKTMWSLFYGDTLAHDLSSARAQVDPLWRDYLLMMRAMWEKSGLVTPESVQAPGSMAAAMARYNEEVKATVPADRLLVWTGADGWEPLCRFLEVPVPDAPFPRVNDAETFDGRIIGGALASINQWWSAQDQGGADH